MEKIRHMQMCNKEFCFSLDKHLPEAKYAHKIRDKQGYGRKLMEYGEKDIKFQRYGMLLTSTQVRAVDKPPYFGNATGYHRRILTKIVKLF